MIPSTQQIGLPVPGRRDERPHELPQSVGKPYLSVIVPAFNCVDDIQFCLDRLALSEFRDAEVIVVDDASTDETAETAARLGARVVRMEQNSGPARARNRAAEEARGDVLLFIDADVGVHPQTLGASAKAFADDPRLDAVFGSYDDAPAAPNLVSQFRNLLHHWTHQCARDEAATFWSGCGAVRRDVFLAHGGFDCRTFAGPSTEDIELGLRMAAAGRRIRVDKSIQATHRKCWRIGGMIRTDVWNRAVPWARLMFERGAIGDDLNTKLSQRMSALLSCALVAVLLIGSLFAPLLAVAPLAAIVLAWCVDAWSTPGVRGRQGYAALVAACMATEAAVAVVALAGGGPLLYWLATSLAIVAAVVAINCGFYGVLIRTNGLLFAAAAIPLHVCYFVYSSAAFVATMLCCRVKGRSSDWNRAAR